MLCDLVGVLVGVLELSRESMYRYQPLSGGMNYLYNCKQKMFICIASRNQWVV